MSASYLLAVDGGQTGTRALLASIDGTILGQGSGGPVRHVFAGGGEETRASLRDAITSAFNGAGVEPGSVSAAALGVTGVQPNGPEADKIAAMVREVVEPERMAVVPDYVTNLEGASAGEPGVVVVAGGGAVAYGRAEDGREAVASGFGYLLGDEGGGYDIGRRAIAAAIRAYDGRDVPTTLEEGVQEAFGLTDLREIKRIVYTPDFSRDRVAALVPLVAGAAESGDEVACRIMTAAGEELARAALAVIHRLFTPGGTVGVYPTGGVFKAGEVIGAPFREAIAREWPEAIVRQPRYAPVLGALILAGRLCRFPVDTAWLERATTSHTTSVPHRP